MKIQRINKHIFVFLIPLLLLFFMTTLFFWEFNRLISLSQWVDHTDQVIAQINFIEKQIVDLESVRGFLITGDSEFLEPYQKANLELPVSIRLFYELLGDNPAQIERMNRIESLLEEWHRLTEESIKFKYSGAEKSENNRIRKKKVIIDSIREKINKMRSEEEALRIQRNLASQHQSKIIYLIITISLLMFSLTLMRSIYLLILKERELVESENKFHSLAEAMPQIVWITKSDGWNIYFNKQWIDYTGLTLEESYGHGWNIPFHPDDQKRAWEAWQNAVLNNDVYSLECRLRRADGIYKWWLIRGVPYFDENGKIIYWFGTCTDIEEIKQAKERLQAAEEKFRGLFETAPDSFVIVDELGMIEVVNQQTEKLFGYTREELIGKKIEVLMPERFQAKHVMQRTGYVKDPKSRPMGASLDLFARHKDGKEFPVEISLSPLKTPQGLVVTCVIRDISEKKMYEKTLLELNTSLERKVLERTAELLKEIQAKEESVRIYRAIGESINYGVWICAPDGRNTYASPSFLKLVGLTQEECSDFGWGNVLHSDDRERTLNAWKECVRTQGTWNMQHRYRGIDGNWHPILARGVPVRNQQGEIFCWAGINLDISELKKVEEELRQNSEALQRSENKFRKVFDSDMIGFFFWNTKGEIIDANDAFLDAVGYTQDDLRARRINLRKLTTPEWIEVDDMALGMFKKNAIVSPYEKEFVKKDGSRLPIEISAAALKGIPEIDGIAYILNISERKRVEKERDIANASLKEANEILQRQMVEKTIELDTFKVMAESIPQLCWIADADGFIFWYNQRWYKYTGKTPKEMEGWGWQSVHDQKILPSVMERWQKSIKTGENFEMEFPLRGADGKFRWFLTRMHPLYDTKNNITHWFGTNTDIDDQKRALTEREDLLKRVENANDQLEQRIKERTQDLEKSNKELEQFAYIASHDLQTPLRHITSYVQLLVSKIKKTTSLDPQTEKWIDYIINGTKQMKNLITDLLVYSRVGRIDIKFEEVNVNKVIADITEILREPIHRTNAKIIYHELPIVYGVESQINQLFQNLIDNAIKFKKPGLTPVVEIKCEDLDKYWKFYVTDNGIGIDLQYSGRIFSMFQRLHTSAEYPGSGIGLAICKKIVEFHGGHIGFDSIEGKGSTFFFSLPKK